MVLVSLDFMGGTTCLARAGGQLSKESPLSQLHNIFLVKKFLFKKIYYLSSALYFDYLMQKALDQ
jgi:hypothetical protein